MPTDIQLEVAEITDFSPGHWTAGGALLMPSRGWQTMQDCRPEGGGGVRAAAKPAAWDLTGITNLSTSSVLAMTVYGGAGVGGADERYLFLQRSTTTLDIWFYSGTTWSLIKSHTLVAGSIYVQTDTFRKATGVQYLMYTIWQNGGNPAVEGLWEINRTAHTSASVDFVIPTSMTVANDIVLLFSGATLYWSVSGTSTMDHVNRFFLVQSSRWESLVNASIYIAPSDILVGSNGVWSLIQGDLNTAPQNRSMNDSHHPSGIQDINMTDIGIPFAENGIGVWLTYDGNNFSLLSQQLDGSAFNSGDIVGAGSYLLAEGGNAYDLRTKSWFTLSALAGATRGYHNRRDNVMVYATPGLNPTVYQVNPNESSRASTYLLKTAPFRGQDGRRVRIRQIQISYKAAHANDTIVVTVNGTTKTYTVPAPEQGLAVFLFKEEAEMLDVTITATANTGTNVAPDIEAIRIGKMSGHRSK